MRPSAKRIVGGILLVMAAVSGAAGALLGFLLAAALTSRIGVMYAAAVLICFAAAFGLSGSGFRRLGLKRRNPPASIFGAGAAIVVSLISFFVFIRPVVPSEDFVKANPPSSVDFWELDSGSRIGFQRFRAGEGIRGMPVIFLHGGPGGAVLTFSPIIGVLSRLADYGFDVYFYDQVGGGLSSRLKDVTNYQISRHVRDLELIRRNIGAERLILVGESHGGVVASRYAAQYPDCVGRLILISPGPFIEQEWGDDRSGSIKDRASPETVATFEGILGNPRILLAALLLEINPSAARGFFPDPEADALISRRIFPLLGGMACDPRKFPENHGIRFGFWAAIIPDEYPEPADPQAKEKLHRLDAPALILKSECDYLDWGIVFEYRAMLRNATLLYIEGAGHMPFLEKPDLVLDCIGAFLLEEPLPLPPYTGTSPPGRNE